MAAARHHDPWLGETLGPPAAFERALEETGFAYAHQPLYNAHLRAAGIDPNDVSTPEEFRTLPVTTKALFRKHFPVGVLASGRTLNDRFIHRSPSSGTGGERLLTVCHTFALAERMKTTLSINEPMLSLFEAFVRQRPMRLAAPNCSDVECASPAVTTVDRILPDGTLVLPIAHDLLATPDHMIEQALKEIEEWAPDWFYADPTHLAFLARCMRRRGLSAPPTCRALAMTYTRSTRVSRRQIRDFFPESVLAAEILSMSEFGWVAMECPRGRLHLNVASFFLELVTDGRPTRPGEVGALIATSLNDRLSPHVRYDTRDLFRLVGECECASAFPAVVHEGRDTDMIVRDDEIVLSPRQLDEIVGHEWIDVYRLEQLDDDLLEFRFIPNDTYAHRAEAELVDQLREVLGSGVDLRVERCDYIPADRSGKFVSCVSRVSQARPRS